MEDSHGSVYAVETDEEFEALLQTAGDTLVAVDFYADWCGPCRMIGPYFISLSTQYSNVIFLKVNIDVMKGTASKYGVRGIPHFIFFRSGAVVDQFSGANTSKLLETIRMHSNAASSATSTATTSTSAPTQPQLSQSSTSTMFPQKTFVFFEGGKLDMINNKIQEIVQQQQQGLLTAVASDVSSLCTLLKQSSESTNTTNNSSKISKQHLTALHTLLTGLPIQKAFPVLDVLRLSLLHSSCGPAFGSSGDVGNQLLQVVLNFLTWAPSTDDTETTTTTTTSSTATAVAVPHATWLMSVRCLANAFKHPQTKQWLVANFAKVVSSTTQQRAFKITEGDSSSTTTNVKNMHVALWTVFLNYCILYGVESGTYSSDSATKKQCIDLLTAGLSVSSDEESQFRIVVALGTLCFYSDASVRSHTTQQIMQLMSSSSFAIQGPKAQQASAELVNLLKSPATPTPTATTSSVSPSAPTSAPFPAVPGFGAHGGGGGLGGVSNNLLQAIMQNPELLQAIQNPQVMQKLQHIMTDPSAISLYQNDPEFLQLLQKMSAVMGNMPQ